MNLNDRINELNGAIDKVLGASYTLDFAASVIKRVVARAIAEIVEHDAKFADARAQEKYDDARGAGMVNHATYDCAIIAQRIREQLASDELPGDVSDLSRCPHCKLAGDWRGDDGVTCIACETRHS